MSRFAVPKWVADASPLFGDREWDALRVSSGEYTLLLGVKIHSDEALDYFIEHPLCTKIGALNGYWMREDFIADGYLED
jgi:hypothetical protein